MIIKSQQKTVPVIVVDDNDFLVGFNPDKLDELLSTEKK
jgi:glutaredoxin